jgi:hypothetical protein
MILKFVIAVVLVEAVAELLTESRITDGLRRLPGALGYFFGCGYCASVWLGIGAAYGLGLSGALDGLGAVEPLLWGLVIHRTSNVLHEAVSRFMGRVPWMLFIRTQGAIPVEVELPLEEPEAGLTFTPGATSAAMLPEPDALKLVDPEPEMDPNKTDG